jgi:uncharacterized protein YjbI with pentapeptide repeats
MPRNYSNKNLRKTSFRNEDFRHAVFYETDLRGADFTGSDLSGARFVNVRTGITPLNVFLIFLGAMLLSALSGYIAMLAGTVVQSMLASPDQKIRIVGIATLVILGFFIFYTYWKGGHKAVMRFMLPVFIFSFIVGGLSYFSGEGTGKGLIYELLALLLAMAMFVVGTVARSTAGSLSNILFVIVALTGGIFSKSLGGGIGTFVMAVSCAVLSKRALSGAKGFETIRKIVAWFTSKMGTSFRDCRLTDTDFSQSRKIRNADFSNADTSFTYWGESRKMNCIQ